MRLHQSLDPLQAKKLMNTAHLSCKEDETTQSESHKFHARQISESKLEIPETVQAIRLQINPLANAEEYAVMHLLYTKDRTENQLDIENLGYSVPANRDNPANAPKPVRHGSDQRNRRFGKKHYIATQYFSPDQGAGKQDQCDYHREPTRIQHRRGNAVPG